MEYEEYVKCIEVLRNEPFFLFKKEDTARKLKCLETLKKSGKPQNIWLLIELLKNDNLVLRDGAAETIVLLFEKIESQTAFYDSLKFIDIRSEDFQYFKAAFSPDIYLNLLFVASLNKSGYIREKAVKELVSTQNPKAVKFIIFRLADWVTNVRESAKIGLRSYFQPSFIDEFLKQITLIDWLLMVERTNLNDIYSEIYRFIFSFDFNESFYEKLRQLNDKTKFIYVRNYLNSNSPDKKIFEILSNDKLFLIKIELLKHIEKLDEDTQKFFIKKFLQDKSAKVRVYAIYSTKPFRPEFYEEILNSIFDISASVRELARFILRESQINFADFYRRRITEDESSLSAILGLSEVRELVDLPIFETYIQKPNVKIKVACLTAINGLNKEVAQKYAIEFLFHSSAKVRNKSIEILAPTRSNEVLEIAREMFQKGDYEQQKSILRLFNRIGGWRVIGDFIIALSDSNEKIQDLGWTSLGKWRTKQLFSKPLPKDLERAERLYNEFDKTKTELSSNRERFWAELPFYLR